MAEFKEFFTEHAAKYSESESHKKGNDLSVLIKLLSDRHYGKALDIATGPGFTAIAVASISNEVVALDPTPAMLVEARKNSMESEYGERISFVEGYADNTGLQTGTFDLVTCRRAAHHFPDKPAFLKEVKRLLKPEGIFAIVDMASPDNDTEGMLDHLETLRDHSHVHAASLKEWTEMIASAGFKIIRSHEELDERTFEDWLYPVDPQSEDGKKSKDFISKNRDALCNSGGWNRNTDRFVKHRIIITARPE